MFETFSTWPVVWQALAATTFTWALTAIGAGAVFFFKDVSPKALDAALGFTAGVMIAASFWSLLNPAIALAEDELVVGLGAQLPFDQGTTEARLAAGALLGKDAPPYVALSAQPVEHENVLEAWEAVYGGEAPADLQEAFASASE